MRLRNNPKAYDIMAENSDLVILEPESLKGQLHKQFEKEQPLFIEIGMGKGDFIYENAKRYPENNYIGIEKYPSVLAAAINKMKKKDIPSNLRLMHYDAIELEKVFDKNMADIICAHLDQSDFEWIIQNARCLSKHSKVNAFKKTSAWNQNEQTA